MANHCLVPLDLLLSLAIYALDDNHGGWVVVDSWPLWYAHLRAIQVKVLAGFIYERHQVLVQGQVGRHGQVIPHVEPWFTGSVQGKSTLVWVLGDYDSVASHFPLERPFVSSTMG
jgi:hypothetical protein